MNTMSMTASASLTDAHLLCVHEAGHAIGAALAGARIDECFARPTEGAVRWSNADYPAGPEISYWGIYAEARAAYGGRPPLSMLREYLANATPEDLEAFGGTPRLLRHIEPQIEAAMPMVRDLALKIYRRGTATHADVEAAMGVGPGTSLAAVRSMLRQGIDPRSVLAPGAGL
ncbi:hypothetical protein AB0H20_12580 [Nocardia fluminea]|uniref:hypothetical protein n=1 Tax=Nocardia fluminea TaxID=134984 RepID=UPI0033E19D3F